MKNILLENKDTINKEAFGKIDYIFLEDEVNEKIMQGLYDRVCRNPLYRGIVFFEELREYFEDFPCVKVMLANYPPERHSFRKLSRIIEKADGVDEIEFPWNKKYTTNDKKLLAILKESIEKGIILRPMLEFGAMEIADISNILMFLEERGIYHVMSSTGLVPEITTPEKWIKVSEIKPPLTQVKIGGIVSVDDINIFTDSGADIAGTTYLLNLKK